MKKTTRFLTALTFLALPFASALAEPPAAKDDAGVKELRARAISQPASMSDR